MIALALRTDIERYAVRMRLENPLFVRAERGTLSADHLAAYLANIHVLVGHTPIHLARAVARTRAAGELSLTHHFEKKCGEEVGHDEWAARDVERVSAMIATASECALTPSLQELIVFIEATIDEDPALYLAYILFSEYLIVLMGPEWLVHLETRCGIPRRSMSVVGNHAELDREHSEEAFESIDELVADPRKLAPMRATLLRTVTLFDRFSAEIIKQGDEARYAASVRTPAA